MVRVKLDNRIRVVIENGVALGQRSLLVVVGDKGRDQVPMLHHILSKASVRARPSVLWCYKKELGFSTHRKKRMRQLQKKLKSGNLNTDDEDPFEQFVGSTQIRYCYYSETHKILGNTYGICILQDFEALTPNLLARTIETVEGGGLVIILLRTVDSLKQLYTLSMDVHDRYRTESHQNVVGRFNERFILSLSTCKACLVMDDRLNILPISSHSANIQSVPSKTKEEASPSDMELASLKETLADSKPIFALLNICKTLDQGKVLLKCLDIVTEKSLKATVSVTAARGRGKSAALGLAIAGAVGFGYSNIFVTSPSPENLKTLFEFVLKGFDALEYQEHLDYDIVQSTNPEFGNSIVRINVTRDHRQTIQYIHPTDGVKLGQAELVVVDEAAAIPLPLVRSLLGPYLVFLSSTINGYEGTGRSLSLKLLEQLRQQTAPSGGSKEKSSGKDQQMQSFLGRSLHELVLEESIRYRSGDQVEAWLNQLLCLDVATVGRFVAGCPPPQECQLYYINRDTLFCFHKASEAFLQRLMSIYVAAHYKNTPNDLQMLSDAPAHHIFCLLGPRTDPAKLPEILCVLQVCLEGEIQKESVVESLSRGKRASGDLIPWTVAQQFQDDDFPSLSGARVVRIATHPDFQGMGYGGRALSLLQNYYEGRITSLSEDEPEYKQEEKESEGNTEEGLLNERPKPRKNLAPLLSKLTERKAERLDYLGVSYGLTPGLIKFWRRAGYNPVYLRQTENELTGEHSCIMLKMLNFGDEAIAKEKDWLSAYWTDFRRRFVSLLSYQFRSFSTSLSLSLLQSGSQNRKGELGREELAFLLSDKDLHRLDLYSRNMVDHHLITDLLPTVATLVFAGRLESVSLSPVQKAVLLGTGLQRKSVEDMVKELDLPQNQILAIFNKTIKKIVTELNSICSQDIEARVLPGGQKTISAKPTKKSLQDDLDEMAVSIKIQQEKARKELLQEDFSEFSIKGSEEDWQNALESGKKGKKPKANLSIKRKVDKTPVVETGKQKKKKQK